MSHFAALTPSPGDLMIVRIGGNQTRKGWPITEYNRAVAATAEFASVLAEGEPPFKLLCLSLPELVGFGYTLRKLIADMKPDEQSEWKQTVRESCLSLLGTDDEKLRAEVRGILDDMGVLNL